MRSLRYSLRLLAAIVILLSVTMARAQITNVTADQATPMPGVGHDYIQMLAETVNPADGSISLRIDVPMPKGRKISIPFAFSYDSNGVHHLLNRAGHLYWVSNQGLFSQGGWSSTVPAVTDFVVIERDPVLGTCDYAVDYMFQDPEGQRHALGLLATHSPTSGCRQQPITDQSSGGDYSYSAATSPGYDISPVNVVNRHGTVYSFPAASFKSVPSPDPGTFGAIASSIEDRNGNKINITSTGPSNFAYADTVGRSVLTYNTNGSNTSVAVSGFSQPYVLATATINANFQIPYQDANPGYNCWGIAKNTDTESIVRSITLPNGQQYTFKYDSDDLSIANPFGVITQITYPSGAWVKYVWGTNPLSQVITYPDIYGNPYNCTDHYDQFAIVTRTVSFDGVNVAQTQSFSYSTTWNNYLDLPPHSAHGIIRHPNLLNS